MFSLEISERENVIKRLKLEVYFFLFEINMNTPQLKS